MHQEVVVSEKAVEVEDDSSQDQSIDFVTLGMFIIGRCLIISSTAFWAWRFGLRLDRAIEGSRDGL
jgi:hypothetical protein